MSCISSLIRPVYHSISLYPDKIGVIDRNGRYTYKHLLSLSVNISDRLLKLIPSKNGLIGERIAFLCNQDVTYIIVQWSIWLIDGICVPLCQDHPIKLLEYYIQDSQSSILISTTNFQNLLQPLAQKLNIPLILIRPEDLNINIIENERIDQNEDLFSNCKNDALIIYTSGTTGPPKGVVHTINTLKSQMDAMIKTWEWKVEDCILNVLPLHHIHGLVNCIMTPLYNGSTLVIQEKFNPIQTWNHLLNDNNPSINIFMGVPSIYIKLIEVYQMFNWNSEDIKKRCNEHIRLFVSGSSALPDSIYEQWKQLTGFYILEQYGMSEVGRILSNRINGKKMSGKVGLPMPDIELRLIEKNEDDSERILLEGTINHLKIYEKQNENICGELFVKGPTLFKYYFNKNNETKNAFNQDQFFATGDMVEYEQVHNTFKILGRISMDIIKSGGYKISALDVEKVLLYHPLISECAVIGISDSKWGESVTAIIVLNKTLNDHLTFNLEELRDYCKEYLPSYSCPTNMKIVEHLDRNNIGKINKKELRQKLFPS